MILPIISYGSSVLKKTAKEITSDYPNLSELIANMWETMYAANGVGLAAPQIGLSLRIFVIDSSPFVDEENMSVKEIETIKKANQELIEALDLIEIKAIIREDKIIKLNRQIKKKVIIKKALNQLLYLQRKLQKIKKRLQN